MLCWLARGPSTEVKFVVHWATWGCRYPVPDMMALTHVLPFRGGGRQADLPGFGQARPLAQELTRAACTGSDPPLPMPLPHMSALARMNERDAAGLAGEGPGAGDWPAGLCGYIVNLVRPQHRGHRASLLYSVLGSTLVFETLADASAYREFVVQVSTAGKVSACLSLAACPASCKASSSTVLASFALALACCRSSSAAWLTSSRWMASG